MIKFIAPYQVETYDKGTIEEVVAYCKTRKVLCIDTETTRRNKSSLSDDPYDTQIIMFQIGDAHNQFIIDTRYTDISCLKRFLESKRIVKIGHNIKYDYKVLNTNYGITLNNVFDTMITDYVLTTGLSVTHSLEECCIRYLKYNPYGNQLSLFDPFITKKERLNISKKNSFEDFSKEEIFYGATDVISTYKLYEVLSKKVLETKQNKIVALENKFVCVLADMELTGLPIREDLWMSLEQENRTLLETLRNSLPEGINWDSPKQVVTYFKEQGIPTKVLDRKTGIEKDSVQTSTITKAVKEQFPLVKQYTEYKGVAKLVSSYGNKFLSNINPATGRIHSSFIQILHTGRISSNSPNLQQIPREAEFRNCFETDKVFISADYSSQEIHVLANKSKEPIMIDGLNRGLDIHKLTAAMAYNKLYRDVTDKERQIGKSINFLIAYGGGAHKLSSNFAIELKTSKLLLKQYFINYSKVLPYFENTRAQALRDGYILIDKLGRRCYFPDYHLAKHDSSIRAEIERKAVNYSIQGESASMSKLAGVFLRGFSKAYRFKLVLMIHDEWIIECAEEDAEQVSKILQLCMEKAARVFLKHTTITCKPVISKRWIKG